MKNDYHRMRKIYQLFFLEKNLVLRIYYKKSEQPTFIKYYEADQLPRLFLIEKILICMKKEDVFTDNIFKSHNELRGELFHNHKDQLTQILDKKSKRE